MALGFFSAPFCRTTLVSSLQKAQVWEQVEKEGVGSGERKKINNQAEDSQRK